MTEILAMIGTPIQWLFIAAVAVLLFAPRLIPVIGRILGRMARAEVRRRYGVTLKPAPRRPVERSPSVETIPAGLSPEPVAEAREEPARADRAESSLPRSSGAAVWGVTALVAGAVAVLLWILLHGR